jgi:hypothetical protein
VTAIELPRTDPTTMPERRTPLLLGGIFLFLCAWACVFRWTGEGDSGMHFMNLLESTHRPYYALYPWARPGFVAIFVWPAMLGLTAAKITAALITTLLCWQTIELARDLRLPRPTLAGFLVITQPLVFYLAADTMTELPFALLLLLAIRAWRTRHFFASFFLIGFLPLVRPEGFFFGPVWGVLTLFDRRLGPVWKRFAWTLVMLHGLMLWSVAGRILSPDHEWDFFRQHWSWAPDSSGTYGRGPWFHHFKMWPYYTGPAVLILWLAGLRGSIRRGMGLPWLVWGVVFGVHSVLWWGGWFGALGLMRIQTTTAFTTALVALIGYDAIANRVRMFGQPTRRGLKVAAWVTLAAVPVAYYVLNPEAWHFVNTRKAAAFVRERRLLDTSPTVFFSDVIATVDADGWQPFRPRINCVFDPIGMRELMKALPIGSIGTWDNQRGQVWHGVTIEFLESIGYEVLFESRFRAPGQSILHRFIPPLRRRPLEQRVVVLKRTQKIEPP